MSNCLDSSECSIVAEAGKRERDRIIKLINDKIGYHNHIKSGYRDISVLAKKQDIAIESLEELLEGIGEVN